MVLVTSRSQVSFAYSQAACTGHEDRVLWLRQQAGAAQKLLLHAHVSVYTWKGLLYAECRAHPERTDCLAISVRNTHNLWLAASGNGFMALRLSVSLDMNFLKLKYLKFSSGWNSYGLAGMKTTSPLLFKKSILLLGLICLDKASTLMLEDKHEDVIVITSTLLGTL